MIELKLPTMTCGHCVMTVTKTVQGLDASARVEADLAEHRVRIETSVAPERVREALAEEGYAALD